MPYLVTVSTPALLTVTNLARYATGPLQLYAMTKFTAGSAVVETLPGPPLTITAGTTTVTSIGPALPVASLVTAVSSTTVVVPPVVVPPVITPPEHTVTYSPGDFDRNHIGLTFGGILPGNEIWQCSVKLAMDTDGLASVLADPILNAIDLEQWMEGSSTAVNAGGLKASVLNFFTASGTGISNAAWLTFAKVSRYGRNGKLLSNGPDDVYEHVYPTSTIGGGTGQPPPNQVALAVTLRTKFSRGPGHSGRFYLPLPIWGVTGNQIGQGAADAVAASAKTFIESISDMPGVDIPGSPGAAVMSRKAGAAVTNKVTGVSVGRVLDTVKRRRQKTAEAYENAAVDQGLF